jgi:hypothetical protein
MRFECEGERRERGDRYKKGGIKEVSGRAVSKGFLLKTLVDAGKP